MPEHKGPAEDRATDFPTRDKVTGNWRIVRDGEHYDLHSSVRNIIRMMMNGTCGTYVGQERCIREFGGEADGKRSF